MSDKAMVHSGSASIPVEGGAGRFAELIARLEAAEVGSRELDWAISEAMGDVPKHSILEVGWDYDWYRAANEWSLWRAKDSEGRSSELWQPKQNTTSLDAALALAERVFGEVVALDLLEDAISAHNLFGFGAKRLPLWFCAEILKALEAKQ